jgi:hypothetical protein
MKFDIATVMISVTMWIFKVITDLIQLHSIRLQFPHDYFWNGCILLQWFNHLSLLHPALQPLHAAVTLDYKIILADYSKKLIN